jgi:hypothetical protein
MGAMFTAMFSFLTLMFSGLERAASGFNHLMTWGDEAAGVFADEARHNRNERVKAMLKEAGITELPKAAERSITGTKKLAKPSVAP